jgi:hypothetical protein
MFSISLTLYIQNKIGIRIDKLVIIIKGLKTKNINIITKRLAALNKHLLFI